MDDTSMGSAAGTSQGCGNEVELAMLSFMIQ